MIPIRRSARKDDAARSKTAPRPAEARIEPDVGVARRGAAAATPAGGLGSLPDREPAAVPSRGGSLLRLYFTRSFKRRQRPGSDARIAAYRKGDLSSRRDPDFGLPGSESGKPARGAEFSQALRRMRET